jgi:hypothetical protein
MAVNSLSRNFSMEKHIFLYWYIIYAQTYVSLMKRLHVRGGKPESAQSRALHDRKKRLVEFPFDGRLVVYRLKIETLQPVLNDFH